MTMTIKEYIRAQKAIWIMASETGCSFWEARQSLRDAIDRAWSEAWKPGSISAQVNWQLVFHSPRKPSTTEFIVGLARELESGKTPPNLLCDPEH